MITIIPAIDIIEGKCVRLTRGDFQTKKVYDDNPLEVAKRYEDAGITRLHLVDLDGARQKQIVNWQTLRQITQQTRLHVDFGGGIQSDSEIALAFECGAAQITAGSIAVKSPEIVRRWLAAYGAEKIILGADVHNGNIAIHGWQERSAHDLFSFLEAFRAQGIRSVICTDIARDGLLSGPAFELYQQIKTRDPNVDLIASGGIKTIADIERLNREQIDGVIIGKALYEHTITLDELQTYL